MKRFGLVALGGATVLVLGLLWAKPLRRAAVPPRRIARARATHRRWLRHGDAHHRRALSRSAARHHRAGARRHRHGTLRRRSRVEGADPGRRHARCHHGARRDPGTAGRACSPGDRTRPHGFRRRRHARFSPPGRRRRPASLPPLVHLPCRDAIFSSPPSAAPPRSSIAPRSSATPIAKRCAPTMAIGPRTRISRWRPASLRSRNISTPTRRWGPIFSA